MNQRNLKIKANSTSDNEGTLHLNLSRENFKMSVVAAKGDSKLPRFSIHAYTGAVIGQPWGRVIVDGAGVKLRDTVKILMDHDPRLPLGHTDGVRLESNANIFLEGPVSGPGSAEYVKNFLESSANDFPWESSIGADVVRSEYLEAGEEATVNGIDIVGPLTIARETLIYETSVVTFGADSDTTAMAAGKNAPTFFHHVQGEHNMFEKWLKANGWDSATLSAEDTKKLRAMFDAEQALEAGKGKTPVAGTDPVAPVVPIVAAAPVAPVAPVVDPTVLELTGTVNALQIEAAEATRVSGINTLCLGKHDDLGKTAIEEKWTVSQVEASVKHIDTIAAERPKPVPNILVAKSGTPSAVLAGAMLSNGIKLADIKDSFKPEDLDAATSISCNGFSDFAELLLIASGYSTAGMNADAKIAAGFSTTLLPIALGELANTSLMAGYVDPADNIGLIARMMTVKNFKKDTKLQMNSDMVLKEVANTGDIEHAQMGETAYEFYVKQYARMLTTSRMDLINDELDVFTGFHNGFGRGATLAEQLEFWTRFAAAEANGHFSIANGNLITNALSIDGLTAAITALGSQVDEWGMPIVITGMRLVVPTALVPYAKQIIKSATLIPVYNNALAEPVTNPHVGAFDVVESKWLNNTNIGNQSATAWYLIANPDDIASFASVHRKGMSGPEIRTAALPVGKLGMTSDAVYDFGSAYVDPKGAVKSTGTA